MNDGLKSRLLAIPNVKGLHSTYVTESSGKWLIIIKETHKVNIRRKIDEMINNIISPEGYTI